MWKLKKDKILYDLYFDFLIIAIYLLFFFYCFVVISGYAVICRSLNYCSIDDYKQIFFAMIILFFIINIVLLVTTILKSSKNEKN
jgi:hypothetical protein